jgi:hypothetical protein
MAITAASSGGGQGVIKWFKFTSIANADTFEGPVSPKAAWVNSESATVGGNVAESAGTYTFYVGGTAAGTLFVIT